MMEEDVIEPITASLWVSNLVIAKMRGGELCLCVDLIDLNKAIIPDKFSLPTANELTSHFYGSTIFSKIDLLNGCLQVSLIPASRDLIAFISCVGVFRYKHVEFGLLSAPSCFQKIMSLILAGIPGVSIYFNNIVVHTPSTMLHNAHLQQLFKQFKHHRVTLNAEKCTLASGRLSSWVSGSPKRASHDHIPH